MIIIHGGNFSGGRPEFGDKLKDALVADGIPALCAEFPFEPHAATVAAITECIEAHSAPQVILVGMSSGGYFAALMRSHPKVSGVVYLAGVLTPALRLYFVPGKRKGSLQHFGDMAAMERAQNAVIQACRDDGGATPALAFLSNNDSNVPPPLWQHEQYRAALGDAETEILDVVHSTIMRPSPSVLAQVMAWIRDRRGKAGDGSRKGGKT